MFDVITIGAATRDVFVKSAAFEIQDSDTPPYEHEACFPMGAKIDIDELVFETGGGATNAAATLSRLGFKTATICAVGDDTTGRDILEELGKDNIADTFVQRISGQSSGYSIIIVAGSGERTILVHRGAARNIAKENVSWDDVNAKLFYISSLGGDLDLLQTALSQASNCAAKISWNPGNSELKLGLDALEPLIRQTDVFNLNLEEAALLTGESPKNMEKIVARLRSLPRRALLITDGERGAYAFEAENALHVTPLEVERVNTTGAGDAFGSGFAAGLLKHDDIERALAIGIWNAAGCIQIMGAKRGLLEQFPSEEQIKKVDIQVWR
jgi:ribokinase